MRPLWPPERRERQALHPSGRNRVADGNAVAAGGLLRQVDRQERRYGVVTGDIFGQSDKIRPSQKSRQNEERAGQ